MKSSEAGSLSFDSLKLFTWPWLTCAVPEVARPMPEAPATDVSGNAQPLWRRDGVVQPGPSDRNRATQLTQF